MRSVQVEFLSGSELLSSYWGFLKDGGLVLRGVSDFTEGEELCLEVRIQSLKKSYSVNARAVKRAEGGGTFVAFAENAGQDEMLNAAWADSHDVPQRKYRRFPTGNEVRYSSQIDQDTQVPGQLLNVSPGGCRLKGSVVFPVGARVKVVALGVELVGQVRWTTPGREMGIEFTKPDLAVQTLLNPTDR